MNPDEKNIDTKLNEYFSGRVVRKDLPKLIKQGANVPIYVLEYLLGMYCATDNEESIENGIKKVKNILAENFVRPDEAEKIKSKIKELGTYKIIDKVTVKLNERKDIYEATFSNLGISNVAISTEYVKKYDKLLVGGIWAILNMEYSYNERGGGPSPFIISSLKPIQMAHLDIDEIFQGRKNFSKDEWIDIMLRSVGLEPDNLEYPVKWHILTRLIPFVENNYNVCELGPRSTGKSYVYKEISPNSILISGGQTTVANLFYNMVSKKIGLVGMWDVVAFDEVAGIRFKDKDGVQIMKDYMASGSFARGKEEKQAYASMVFVGNINHSIESLLKTSHLFSPFPDEIANDSAFFDRMHFYIPGWEIPKMRPEFFTNRYGFIVDYLAEFFREMRKRTFSDFIDKYFILGKDLNQRDVISVRKTVSGLIKLIYPDGIVEKDGIKEILEHALIGRRRVKEQLKKIGGMEFYDVHFSYRDKDNNEEYFVSVPEMNGGKLIPEEREKPGNVYLIARSNTGMLGVYRLENKTTPGSGKFSKSGFGSLRGAKESLDISFNYFLSNSKRVSASINTKNFDFLTQIIDLQGIGMTESLSLAELIGLFSSVLEKPVLEGLVITGSMTIGGTVNKLDNLADIIQVSVDAGAKKILIPASSASDFATVPSELISKIQLIFYSDPIDAVFKALDVN